MTRAAGPRWVLGPADGLSLAFFYVMGNRRAEISPHLLQLTKVPRTRGPGQALGTPGWCGEELTQRKEAARGFPGPGGTNHRFLGVGNWGGTSGFGHEGQDVGKTGPHHVPMLRLQQGLKCVTGDFSNCVGPFVLPSLPGSPDIP